MKRLRTKNLNTLDYWNGVYREVKADEFYLKDPRYLIMANFASEGDRVLDVGCGDGGECFVVKTIRKTTDVFGIDISQTAIDKARRIYGSVGTFKLGSATEIPYPDDFFDLVICGEVLEHLEDPEKAIKELLRVVKKGGRLLISTPYKETMVKIVSFEHLWSFDGKTLCKFCKKYADKCWYFPWASGSRQITDGKDKVLSPVGYLDILLVLAIK